MTRRYGDEYIEVPADSFCRLALDLSIVTTDCKLQRHQLTVVPTLFSAMPCINDRQCLQGGESGTESWCLSPRKTIKELGAAAATSKATCKMQQALQKVSLRNITVAEEL